MIWFGNFCVRHAAANWEGRPADLAKPMKDRVKFAWPICLEHFKYLVETKLEFLRLDYYFIEKLLSDNKLNVDNEFTVFQAIIIWIATDREQRYGKLDWIYWATFVSKKVCSKSGLIGRARKYQFYSRTRQIRYKRYYFAPKFYEGKETHSYESAKDNHVILADQLNTLQIMMILFSSQVRY